MKKHRREVLFSGIITAIGTHTTVMLKWYKFMFSINLSNICIGFFKPDGQAS